MSDTIAATQDTTADYRPFHRTSQSTVWSSAFQRRDACYDAILREFEARQLKALLVKSENGQYPPFVRLEAWKPLSGGTSSETDSRIRSDMELQFKAMPYHEHPVVTTARAKVANRAIAVADRPRFSVSDAVDWALYTVGAQGKPRNYRPVSDFFSNAFLSLIPFVRTLHSNRIERRFRNSFRISLPMVLGLIGVLLGATGFTMIKSAGYYDDEQISIGILLLVLAALPLIVALIVRGRRKMAVSVSERPTIPPRYLLMLDSWHAVIPDLGPAAGDLKKKILRKLSGLDAAGITSEIERYGFRTPNGFDERDRIVVSKGQGVAHIHVYNFGKDLFVGWDSYANWAQWQETPAISKRHIKGSLTEYRGLQAGVYVPNQFDLIDLNSLTELVHRDITRIVKAAMEEHKIDQEIDFSIIRGDREAALDREKYDRRTKQEGRKSERRWRIS